MLYGGDVMMRSNFLSANLGKAVAESLHSKIICGSESGVALSVLSILIFRNRGAVYSQYERFTALNRELARI